MGYAAEHGIKLLAFDIDGTLYPKAAMNRRLVISSLLHLPFALKYNSMRRQIRNETGFSVPSEDNLEAFQIRQAEILGKSLDWFQKKAISWTERGTGGGERRRLYACSPF